MKQKEGVSAAVSVQPAVAEAGVQADLGGHTQDMKSDGCLRLECTLLG